MKYRADIDGMRTIAVLSVLFYHAGFSGISGGFIGVDVFFVISGYLITRIIHDEVVASGKFDFGRFYARRVRRLFPTMAAVILLTGFAALFILPQDLFQRFAGSVIHAILSLSNIFFWSESGYFDVGSKLKPLLHTWSLSVEEQFYLVWPALLVLLITRLGRMIALGFLIVLSVLSFVAGEFLLSGGLRQFVDTNPGLVEFFAQPQSAVFFLTPFRIFEFACGAVLVWLGNGSKGNAVIHTVMSVIGIVMIAYGLFFVAEGDHFPSYNALIPCIGTALLIASPKGLIVQPVLRLKPIVWIGLISYTLYLVHWPIMVFYKYLNPGDLSVIEKLGLIGASFALSVLIYYTVEKPLRRPKEGGKGLSAAGFGLATAGIATLLIFPSIHAYKGNIAVASAPAIDPVEANRDALRAIGNYECLLAPDNTNRKRAGSVVCNDRAPIQMLTLGNSHEGHAYYLLREAFDEEVEGGKLGMTFTETHARGRGKDRVRCGLNRLKDIPLKTTAENCAWMIDYLNDTQTVANKYDVVTIGAFRPLGPNGLIYLKYVEELQRINPDLKVIILGSFVDLGDVRCIDLVNATRNPKACQSDRVKIDYFDPDEEARIRETLPELDFLYVSQINILCDTPEYKSCNMTKDGLPFIFDAHHFNAIALRPMVEGLKRTGQYETLKQFIFE